MELGGVSGCPGVFASVVRARIRKLMRLKAAALELKGRELGKASMLSCTRPSLLGHREVGGWGGQGNSYPKTKDSEFITQTFKIWDRVSPRVKYCPESKPRHK